MKPEDQRIAIAEACGKKWKSVPFITGGSWDENFPDYLNDLNAMHKAEQSLTWETQLSDNMRSRYEEELKKVLCRKFEVGTDAFVPPWYFAVATAATRSEAFLKTIGKWQESS